MASYYDFNAIPGYTIGAGVLSQLKRITYGMGKRFLLIGDNHLDDATAATIQKSFASPLSEQEPVCDNPIGRGSGLLDNLEHNDFCEGAFECAVERLAQKVCTYANAQLVGQVIRGAHPDVVIAIGGSRVLDLVRAGLHYCGSYNRPRLVMIPTVLNSNSCATSISVMYDEEGSMCDFWNLGFPAEQIVVDTELLSRVPARQLASGIGDQVSSSIEALHSLEHMGGLDAYDPLCVAHHRAVLDVIRHDAREAVSAAGTGAVTPAFEHICHVLSRYTGPELACATSFLSHVLDEALIGLPELSGFMHGELVGYGVMPEMVIANDFDSLEPWARLFRAIGIPVTLADLGIADISRERLFEACRAAEGKIMASCAVVHFTSEQIVDAIFEADERVVELLQES